MKWSEMTPRERDALVAEKVMGLNKEDYYSDYDKLSSQKQNVISRGQGWFPEPLKNYSTDIKAAWEVVEKLTSEKWLAFKVLQRPSRADANEAWTKGLKAVVEIIFGGQGVNGPPLTVKASSAPEAICLAALRVVGVEI